LTPREQALLTALMYRHGRPVAKGQLFEQVFNLDDEAGLDSIDLYIHRLRKKLVGSGVVITTLRGLGYLLEAAPEASH
ncbi:MAG: winged helix-turn-helix domain-containing protein, partial [Aeromonas sobria]